MKKVCYVIHPSQDIPKWSSVLKLFIKPAVQAAGFQCVVGLPLSAPGSPIDDVIKPLLQADMVVADVTGGQDPAVFYLLGVRHARSNGTILIAQKQSDILQDFRPYHLIVYQPDIDAQAIFLSQFQELAGKIQSEPARPDNPVQQYIHHEVGFQETIEALQQQVADLERRLAARETGPQPPLRPAIRFKRVS